ncbi:hypothetical protein HJC23_002773 [Cyclotella cryptica]|uniref:CBF1-interacting co-repressor CIR N-terminal domain-containing protein n=1 Tax=Cyclotella cryptica TaxID=29204 RepID=A0ABD3PFA3_9STRA
MSGRLIITTKKTYCPWNPANVERVLRDERLERERIEREAQHANEATKQQRRGDETRGNQDLQGHINLFPEAEEAELRLAQGGGRSTKSVHGEKQVNGGVMPVPLGGEEASNRKAGRVPFYMRSNREDDATFGNASNYTGEITVLGRKVEADAITGKIMSEQYESREMSRKSRIDPMSRFYSSGQCKSVENCSTAVSTDHRLGQSSIIRRNHESENRHRTESKTKRRKEPGTVGSKEIRDSSSVASSNSSSESSSHSVIPHSKTTRKRENKKRKRSKHSRDRKYSYGNKRDHRSSSMRSSDEFPFHLKATTSGASQMQSEKEVLDNLRKKRHAREARENQREKHVLGIHDRKGNFGNDRDRGYQDQYNPMLSRK